MAFLWNHQMFLQLFSKKVCFYCILGCFSVKNRWKPIEKLPQMSQICTDAAAAWEEPPTEYTDITEPTAENILPQIPLNTDANFRGCTCLKCTNRAILIYLLLRVRLYDMYCCLLRRLSPPLRMGAHPNNLCRSVKSVGGIRTLTICADLWNLWENITARRFCEFCGFCGRKSQ